ncbi:uncharacterized protein LOC111055689 [Nilaparvata lugens]|uniref:uncharacterized protein LOC111055689 n=1 Tax=Nilaparvata lugens TaxID=108931 RepID=UPI00193CD229|nr:uncharacterized protein LOC111055689 [Nilaparvata lugens]
MTSRVTSGQRLACLVAGFAILLLLGLLGVLWTARLGIFTNFGEKSPPSRRGVTSFPLTHSSTPVSSSTPKQNGDASNKKSEFEEFVKPIKTSPGSPNEHNLVFGNNIWARRE